jgi:hypothetical protein
MFVLTAGPFSSFRLAAFKIESASLIDFDKPARTRMSSQSSAANATETTPATMAQ